MKNKNFINIGMDILNEITKISNKDFGMYDFIVDKCDALVSDAYKGDFIYPESVNSGSEKNAFDMGVMKACNIIVNCINKELFDEEQRKKTEDN